uniref:Uncharacterized protein n=1 Tax=Anopheles minimus TaxID=112268 RepID=A0A182WAL8_9DIPT
HRSKTNFLTNRGEVSKSLHLLKTQFYSILLYYTNDNHVHVVVFGRSVIAFSERCMCFKRGAVLIQIWMGYVSTGARIRRAHVNQSTDIAARPIHTNCGQNSFNIS